MAVLLSNPVSTALDADANVKSGATRTFYLTGTTTAADVYEDADENTPHAQPIEALANGRWPAIYVPEGTALKMVQDNGGGDSITVDPVNAVFSTDTINFQQEGSGAGIRTSKSKLQESLSVEDYYSGTSDDRTAAMRVFDRIIARGGGTAHFTADSYLFTSQVTLDCDGLEGLVHVDGHGAVLRTSGAISALRAIRHNDRGLTISNLLVDHVGNADAIAGIELGNTVGVNFDQVHVRADGDVPATYAAFHLYQTDPDDGGTACFWTRFPGCSIRSSSGIVIPRGVWLDGGQNATDFYGMRITGTTDAIYITKPTDTTEATLANQRFANSVSVRGAWIEGVTNAVHQYGVSGNSSLFGLIVDSRLETVTKVLKITGADLNNAQPPSIILRQTTQDVTTIADVPSGVRVNIEDYRAGGFGEETRRWTESAVRIADASGDGIPKLTVEQAATGKGLSIDYNNAGTVLETGSLGYSESGKLELKSNVAGFVNLFLSGIAGLSAGATKPKNFIGVSTANGSGDGTVTFGTAEPDTNYYPFFCVINGTAKTDAGVITARSTTGFTYKVGNDCTIVWWIIRTN